MRLWTCANTCGTHVVYASSNSSSMLSHLSKHPCKSVQQPARKISRTSQLLLLTEQNKTENHEPGTKNQIELWSLWPNLLFHEFYPQSLTKLDHSWGTLSAFCAIKHKKALTCVRVFCGWSGLDLNQQQHQDARKQEAALGTHHVRLHQLTGTSALQREERDDKFRPQWD